MAQDIKKGTFNIKGDLGRVFARIYRYDAGPNKGTLRTKPKPEPVKKKPRSGNIGNIDMKDFKSSNVIIGKADNIGKKMSPSKLKNKTYIVDGKKISASSRQEALKKAKTTKRTTNAAGQRMGQRKAGGIIKAKNGTLTDKGKKEGEGRMEAAPMKKLFDKMFKESDTSRPLSKEGVMKTAAMKKLFDRMFAESEYSRPLSKEGAMKSRMVMKTAAMKKLAKKQENKKPNLGQRKAGGMMKKYTKGGMNKYNKGSMLGDLDKDGVMSGYEQKRQGAITTAMGNKKMSGGMAKKKMMGGGMMQYNKGAGKKGVTVQSRGCGAVISKRKTKVT